ncbi:beta-1,3-galactosyltransferase 5-like [Daphnia pulicaria]|uniref:beta-1,3-galactosyltransferase 5-like n=1 Tax=Daphnia pulicaria TaxID=35523 RepID=UPI001EE9C86A|nr:beta-1,3-galactosyltransferase 5-like [Daphnia pulicaria]
MQDVRWEAREEMIKLCRKEKKNSSILSEEDNRKFQKTNVNLAEIIKLPNTQEANITIQREFFNYMAANLRNTSYPGVENYTRYAVARLGLLPLANAEPLKPEFGPVINDVLSFRYPITIQQCPNVTVDQISVFIAVISAPNNFEKRKMIRQTWKNHLKMESDKGLLVTAGFGFIVGLTANNVTQAKIEEESKLYGDIIQIGVSDFYRNLSSKVAGLFNWLYRHCSKVDFLLKVDDDVYVNVRNLTHFLKLYYQLNISVFGSYPSAFIPNRDGKWDISFEEWPWNQYPEYITGGTILIPGSAIIPLLAASQTTPMMPFDDVYLTGLCTEKAGLKIHFSPSIFVRELPVKCDLSRVIAWVSDNQVNSHVATDNFYRSTIHQCIFNDTL